LDDHLYEIFKEDQSKETLTEVKEEQKQVGETQREIDKEIELLQISSKENALGKWRAFSWAESMNQGKEIIYCKYKYYLFFFSFLGLFCLDLRPRISVKRKAEIQDRPKDGPNMSEKYQDHQRSMDSGIAV